MREEYIPGQIVTHKNVYDYVSKLEIKVNPFDKDLIDIAKGRLIEQVWAVSNNSEFKQAMEELGISVRQGYVLLENYKKKRK